MSDDFMMGLLCGALGVLVALFVIGWALIGTVFPENDREFLCEKCAGEIK